MAWSIQIFNHMTAIFSAVVVAEEVGKDSERSKILRSLISKHDSNLVNPQTPAVVGEVVGWSPPIKVPSN